MALPSENPDETGAWSEVFSWPLIGIHSVVTPDGKILSFGTDQNGIQGGMHVYDVWDPITNTHQTITHEMHTDLFCSVALIIPDTSQILVAGGDARPLGHTNDGVADVNVFDSASVTLVPSPTGPMAFPRWYPTLLSLANDQLVVLGGRDTAVQYSGYPEIYTPGFGWRTLTGAYIDEYSVVADYPRSWVASNGKIITFAASGTASTIYAMDPTGSGAVAAVGQLPTAVSWYQPAIMFDQDRALLVADDGSAWVMDFSGAQPVFHRTDDIGTDRKWANLVVLPDGRIMISGGSAVANQLVDVDNTVQIWDPDTGHWSLEADAGGVARLYHATTILLPDASVLSLGGGAPGPLVNTNGEIYQPDYLFDANQVLAPRPVITQAPNDLDVGQDFTIQVDNPAAIQSLALLAFGATTHSFNMAARRLELTYIVQADGSLRVDLPDNANVLTPGHWMLFAINSDGTPSIASTIRIHSDQTYYLPSQIPLDLHHLGFEANGRAAYDGFDDTFVVTPDALFRSGSVFSEHRIDLGQSFDLTFAMNVGNVDAAADGLAFVLHNDPLGSAAIGGTGGALGATGIANGLGIEFDIYQNSEIVAELANDHTSFFDTDVLTADPSISPATDLGNIEDGQWHAVRVSWSGQTLTYWFDGALVQSLNQDIVSTYLGGSQFAYFGFTGSTGGASTEQEVRILALDTTLEDGTHVHANRTELPEPPQFVTNGTAMLDGLQNEYVLTPNAQFSAGSVMSQQRIDLQQRFDLAFEINAGGDDTAADGMAFVLHNDVLGDRAIGGTGGTLGATGIASGLGIEFDIYQNSEIATEPLNDHTGFFDTDVLTTDPSVSPVNSLGNIEDGQWHRVQVSWDGQTLTYWFDSVQITSLSQTQVATLLDGSPFAHFGFTGSTGGAAAEQRVRLVALDATAEDGTLLHVVGPNSDPVAVDDSYSVGANGVLTISALNGVLANDGDPDGDVLSVCEGDEPHLQGHGTLLAPAHGVLTMNDDGGFVYTPDAGFVGVDYFHYCVEDAWSSSEGEVTIVVTGVNNTPTVAKAIADQMTAAGQAFSLTLLADTFIDIDPGDTLTLSTSTLPGWLAFDAGSRTFAGTPGPGDVGVVSVTVTATDLGGASSSDTFEIVVASSNVAPVITSNGGGEQVSVAIQENTTAVTTVAASDANVGQTLSFAIVSGLDRDRFSINGTTGALSFVSPPDFEVPSGAGGDNVYEIVVEVSDGQGGTDTQAISVMVQNQPGLLLTGTNSANTLLGAGEEDTLNGLGGADTLQGLSSNDILNGGAGNDLLDGGLGGDVMSGGTGNDTFVVDGSGDVVVESIGGGTDVVRTLLAAYVLDSNVENLAFAGAGSFEGTGNSSANTITGGSAGDILDGLGGADRLIGLAGDDFYFVDSASDVVVETANSGVDTVRASAASYSLSGNVENLTYVGASLFKGTGNGLANFITGGAADDILSGGGGGDVLFGLDGNDTLNGDGGADLLDGGLGGDTMSGGAGADIYLVDNPLDSVVEAQGAGADDVRTSLQSYSLTANVEGLTFTGSGAFQGTGNALSNVIVGGGDNDVLMGAGGNDSITGLAGSDLLFGGAGDDTFVFQPGFGNDVVADFQIGTSGHHDTLDLRLLGFVSIQNVLDNTDLGANATIHAGNDTITLTGVTRAQLQTHMYDLLI